MCQAYSLSLRLRFTLYFGLLFVLCLVCTLGLPVRAVFEVFYMAERPDEHSDWPGQTLLLVASAPLGILVGTRVTESLVDNVLDAMAEPSLADLRATVAAFLGLPGFRCLDGSLLVVVEGVPLSFGVALCIHQRAVGLRTFLSGYTCGAIALAIALSLLHSLSRLVCALRPSMGELRSSFLRQKSFMPLGLASSSPRVDVVKADALASGSRSQHGCALVWSGAIGFTTLLSAYMLAELKISLGIYTLLGIIAASSVLLSWGLHGFLPSTFGGKYNCMVGFNAIFLLLVGTSLQADLQGLSGPHGDRADPFEVGSLPGIGPSHRVDRMLKDVDGDLPRVWRPQDRAMDSAGYIVCNSRWGHPADDPEHQLSALDLAAIAASIYWPTEKDAEHGLSKAFTGTSLGAAKHLQFSKGRKGQGFWAVLEIPGSRTSIFAVRGAEISSDARMLDRDAYTSLAVLRFLDHFSPALQLMPHCLSSLILAALTSPLLHNAHAEADLTSELEAFVASYLDDHPERQVVFTGHSLGGVAAAAVATKFKRPALIFSSPGRLLGKSRMRAEVGEVPESILEISPERDIMPRFDRHVSTTVQSIRCEGSVLECSSLVMTTCELWRSCGDARGRDFSHGCAGYIHHQDMPPAVKHLADNLVYAFGQWYNSEDQSDKAISSSVGDGFQRWHTAADSHPTNAAKPDEKLHNPMHNQTYNQIHNQTHNHTRRHAHSKSGSSGRTQSDSHVQDANGKNGKHHSHSNDTSHAERLEECLHIVRDFQGSSHGVALAAASGTEAKHTTGAEATVTTGKAHTATETAGKRTTGAEEAATTGMVHSATGTGAKTTAAAETVATTDAAHIAAGTEAKRTAGAEVAATMGIAHSAASQRWHAGSAASEDNTHEDDFNRWHAALVASEAQAAKVDSVVSEAKTSEADFNRWHAASVASQAETSEVDFNSWHTTESPLRHLELSSGGDDLVHMQADQRVKAVHSKSGRAQHQQGHKHEHDKLHEGSDVYEFHREGSDSRGEASKHERTGDAPKGNSEESEHSQRVGRDKGKAFESGRHARNPRDEASESAVEHGTGEHVKKSRSEAQAQHREGPGGRGTSHDQTAEHMAKHSDHADKDGDSQNSSEAAFDSKHHEDKDYAVPRNRSVDDAGQHRKPHMARGESDSSHHADADKGRTSHGEAQRDETKHHTVAREPETSHQSQASEPFHRAGAHIDAHVKAKEDNHSLEQKIKQPKRKPEEPTHAVYDLGAALPAFPTPPPTEAPATSAPAPPKPPASRMPLAFPTPPPSEEHATPAPAQAKPAAPPTPPPKEEHAKPAAGTAKPAAFPTPPPMAKHATPAPAKPAVFSTPPPKAEHATPATAPAKPATSPPEEHATRSPEALPNLPATARPTVAEGFPKVPSETRPSPTPLPSSAPLPAPSPAVSDFGRWHVGGKEGAEGLMPATAAPPAVPAAPAAPAPQLPGATAGADFGRWHMGVAGSSSSAGASSSSAGAQAAPPAAPQGDPFGEWHTPGLAAAPLPAPPPSPQPQDDVFGQWQ